MNRGVNQSHQPNAGSPQINVAMELVRVFNGRLLHANQGMLLLHTPSLLRSSYVAGPKKKVSFPNEKVTRCLPAVPMRSGYDSNDLTNKPGQLGGVHANRMGSLGSSLRSKFRTDIEEMRMGRPSIAIHIIAVQVLFYDV